MPFPRAVSLCMILLGSRKETVKPQPWGSEGAGFQSPLGKVIIPWGPSMFSGIDFSDSS